MRSVPKTLKQMRRASTFESIFLCDVKNKNLNHRFRIIIVILHLKFMFNLYTQQTPSTSIFIRFTQVSDSTCGVLAFDKFSIFNSIRFFPHQQDLHSLCVCLKHFYRILGTFCSFSGRESMLTFVMAVWLIHLDIYSSYSYGLAYDSIPALGGANGSAVSAFTCSYSHRMVLFKKCAREVTFSHLMILNAVSSSETRLGLILTT